METFRISAFEVPYFAFYEKVIILNVNILAFKTVHEMKKTF